MQSGWNKSIEFFLSKGYTMGELYGFTWGDADIKKASLQYHSKSNLESIRKFILAVLEYTKSKKVNIISHSMGVTLARKAILGGLATDILAGGTYDLGEPLTEKVACFIGIAGANLGLQSCLRTRGIIPTCSSINGLFPGYQDGLTKKIINRSQLLEDLLKQTNFEGERIYSIWSEYDEIIKYKGLVYGEATSRIPGQTGEFIFQDPKMGHFQLKEDTVELQWKIITNQI